MTCVSTSVALWFSIRTDRYGRLAALTITRPRMSVPSSEIYAGSSVSKKIKRLTPRCEISVIPSADARARISATSTSPLTLSGGSPKRSMHSSKTSIASSCVRTAAMRLYR